MRRTTNSSFAYAALGALVGAVLLILSPAIAEAQSGAPGATEARSAGSHGHHDARTVQRQLRRAGEDPGPIDGHLGGRAEAAIRRFQHRQGLPVDGIVGRLTAAALSEPSALMAPGAGIADPQGSARVRMLQRRLRRAGMDPGPIDGRFGPLTEVAVRSFQRREKLPVDGLVDKATAAALAGRPARGDRTETTSDSGSVQESPSASDAPGAGRAGAPSGAGRSIRVDAADDAASGSGWTWLLVLIVPALAGIAAFAWMGRRRSRRWEEDVPWTGGGRTRAWAPLAEDEDYYDDNYDDYYDDHDDDDDHDDHDDHDDEMVESTQATPAPSEGAGSASEATEPLPVVRSSRPLREPANRESERTVEDAWQWILLDEQSPDEEVAPPAPQPVEQSTAAEAPAQPVAANEQASSSNGGSPEKESAWRLPDYEPAASRDSSDEAASGWRQPEQQSASNGSASQAPAAAWRPPAPIAKQPESSHAGVESGRAPLAAAIDLVRENPSAQEAVQQVTAAIGRLRAAGRERRRRWTA